MNVQYITTETQYIKQIQRKRYKKTTDIEQDVRIYDQLNQIAILVVLQMTGSRQRARGVLCGSLNNSNSSCLVAGDLKQ